MSNHGKWNGKENYSYKVERTTIPEAIGYIIAGTIVITCNYARKIITTPLEKRLEKIASKTVEGICHAEGLEDSDLD